MSWMIIQHDLEILFGISVTSDDVFKLRMNYSAIKKSHYASFKNFVPFIAYNSLKESISPITITFLNAFS